MLSPHRPDTTPGIAGDRGRPRHRRGLGLMIAGLVLATGVTAGATDTPAVWAVPGAVLILAMWITRRPRRAQVRAAAAAAVALSAAAAAVISPAVLLLWPAAGLAARARRRGLRAIRGPLTVAGGALALVVVAAQVGLPPGVALLAVAPLVLIAGRGRACGARTG